MKEVVRFGRNSLVSARQFKKVIDITRSDRSRRCVVPSAPGKRSDKDEKVMDLLYACYDAVAGGRSYKKILEKIKSRYMDIIDDLDLNPNLDHEFDKVEENFLAKAGRDYAAFHGEHLDGVVATNSLESEFVNVAEVILFDENRNFRSEHINRELSERLERMEKAVIPGFYGSRSDGTIETFSGNGLDVIGFIVAKAIHANMYENWTGVLGILVIGPRIMENPEVIETIAYKELRKLSYMGASVLHEDITSPVRKEDISINIRDTNRPEDKGVLIVRSTCCKPRYTITGIAGKKGFCSTSIEKAMMNIEVGLGRKVSSMFEQYGIPFKYMPSGIGAMIVYVHQSEFEGFEQPAIVDIHRAVEPDTMELESDLALIAVVGRGICSTRGVAGRIFSALARARVSVKITDQGPSEWNIIIGMGNDDFETAVRAIYDIFVTTEL